MRKELIHATERGGGDLQVRKELICTRNREGKEVNIKILVVMSIMEACG